MMKRRSLLITILIIILSLSVLASSGWTPQGYPESQPVYKARILATPSVTKYGANPANSWSLAMISFFCNYSNSANEPPSYVRIQKALTTSPVNNLVANNSFTDYTVGVSYYYNWYYFPFGGTSQMSLTTKSATSGVVTKTIFVAQNPMPTLTLSGVAPIGNTHQNYTFFTNFSDPSNVAPTYVRVTIDGVSYDMSKNNSGDTNYLDGCNYFYTKELNTGNHTYSFHAHSTFSYLPDVSSGTYWFIVSSPSKAIPFGLMLILLLIAAPIVVIWRMR